MTDVTVLRLSHLLLAAWLVAAGGRRVVVSGPDGTTLPELARSFLRQPDNVRQRQSLLNGKTGLTARNFVQITARNVLTGDHIHFWAGTVTMVVPSGQAVCFWCDVGRVLHMMREVSDRAPWVATSRGDTVRRGPSTRPADPPRRRTRESHHQVDRDAGRKRCCYTRALLDAAVLAA